VERAYYFSGILRRALRETGAFDYLLNSQSVGNVAGTFHVPSAAAAASLEAENSVLEVSGATNL
jgi:hypothetical protein